MGGENFALFLIIWFKIGFFGIGFGVLRGDKKKEDLGFYNLFFKFLLRVKGLVIDL